MACGRVPEIENEKNGDFFYRLKAEYTVVKTGEIVEFDIVVGCNIKAQTYSYTGPSYRVSRSPEVIAQATTDGHAVMIQTPKICHQQTLDQTVKNFLPYAIWFDDVSDLSFGWGYATQDAYERANAKLAYGDSSIERATQEEWEEWRAEARKQWKQVGALPGPWGYSPPRSSDRTEQQRVYALNKGRMLATRCRGYRRAKLIDSMEPSDAREDIMAPFFRFAKKYPERVFRDRFLLTYGEGEIVKAVIDLKHRGDDVFGGYSARQLRGEIFGTLMKPPNIRSRDGETGIFTARYWEAYPLVTYPKGLTEGSGSTTFQILYGEEWLGVEFCGSAYEGRASGKDEIEDPRLIDGNLQERKATPVFLNQEILIEDLLAVGARNPGGASLGFVELDGYVWR